MKAHIGQRISAENKILLRDKPVWLQVSLGTEILVLNKNAGTVCSRKDDKGRTTIFRELPKPAQGRWVSVGRLDIATTGLIVLTNNGKLANRMMHPSSGIDKEYAVRVNGRLTDEILQSLKKGAKVDGELLRFSDIRFFDGSGVNNWYHVVLMDGKNREVRNLFDFFGLSVSRLKRVRFGPILAACEFESRTTRLYGYEMIRRACVNFLRLNSEKLLTIRRAPGVMRLRDLC